MALVIKVLDRMVDDACEVKPTWNAAVCKGDVGARVGIDQKGGTILIGGRASVGVSSTSNFLNASSNAPPATAEIPAWRKPLKQS